MEQPSDQVRQRAVDLAAETMGELMAFWVDTARIVSPLVRMEPISSFRRAV